MSGCEWCDFVGPDETGTMSDLRESHRAWHGLVAAVFDPICDWQGRVLDHAMEASARGILFNLTLPLRGRRL